MWLLNPYRFGAALGDPDAQAYITAVETADGQALETVIRDAINAFVVGCKADGIWDAIKACCIMAGARTLAGALVPLKGPAPTSFNFTAGNYNRKTGLAGNASNMYLNSNRNNNADPQDNKHLSVYKTGAPISTFGTYIAAQVSAASRISDSAGVAIFAVNGSTVSSSFGQNQLGFMGTTRSSSDSISYRAGNKTTSVQNTSTTPVDLDLFVFARNLSGAPSAFTDARMAFYSIGESLDLALLDARATTLINAFASPSIVLPNIGDPFQGGFYAGLISHTANGVATHALIVAPAATGATGTGYPVTTGLRWKTTNTSTPGANSEFDGVANMAAVVAAGIADHPAFEFCYNLTIGGFNDWYLPSTREYDIAYFNLKPTTDANNTTAVTANPYAVPPRSGAYAAGGPPVQTTVAAFQSPNGAERFATGVTGANHLSSTELSATEGTRFAFESGFNGVIVKSSLRAVRAFRRIAL